MSSERLWKRVRRIVSGSVNSVVSSLEGAVPESVMEETIRDVEGAMDEVRDELGKVVAGKHLANKRLMAMNRKYEELTGQIELAVRENRDDLAEAAISKQMDIEAQIPILEATLTDNAAQEKELESYISALKAQKREMTEVLAQYRDSVRAETVGASEDASPSASAPSDVERRVAGAQATFERVTAKAGGMEALSSDTGRSDAVKLAELEEMARRNRVQERLAALKGEGAHG
ncbi:PspA/IM30 family protein [Desulfoluna spongiiphila]|uniref:Phage shock protein A (PspA) family protein n=1 Tax=Desulfoluna spongiiphila TaxID=419481 RepID=A0A1G5ANR3_9BACT|nr:PspA/IM30 family protein [Desulfoluna spongiiphila]SCX79482.1 phage shock protein A (PspA) family protein [Desulfoluna spongiiphila]